MAWDLIGDKCGNGVTVIGLESNEMVLLLLIAKDDRHRN